MDNPSHRKQITNAWNCIALFWLMELFTSFSFIFCTFQMFIKWPKSLTGMLCVVEREKEKERKRERGVEQEGESSVHLWQEAALEFSQLCVKTHQAIFVARMIYVRPFVARTNLCHNGINKYATCAAIGLLQIPLCGHLRRHVQRIYLALECLAKPIKNTRIFKMLFQIHRIIVQSEGRISWMA